MVKVFKILKNTTVEGPGKRFCIWTQGCKKHCKDCYAKDTWDFDAGISYSVNELFELIKNEKDIEGVTFLGGEPFEQAKELSQLAQRVKSELKKTILTFSGYTYEELISKNNININNLLNNTDLLIDGGFEVNNFDLSRPWVGSSNQRYIFLTDRYSLEEILRYKNKIEMRLNKDGQLEINGMGDFEQIKKRFCLHLGENIVK